MTENDFFCHSDLILTTNERNEWDVVDHFPLRESSQLWSFIRRHSSFSPLLIILKWVLNGGMRLKWRNDTEKSWMTGMIGMGIECVKPSFLSHSYHSREWWEMTFTFLSHSNVIPIIPGNDENWHFKSFLSHSDVIPIIPRNGERLAFQVIPQFFLDRMIKEWVHHLWKC